MYMLRSTIWSPIGTEAVRRSPSSGMFTEKLSPGGCMTLQFLRVVESAQSKFAPDVDGCAGAAFMPAVSSERLVNSGTGPLRLGLASAIVSFTLGAELLRVVSA